MSGDAEDGPLFRAAYRQADTFDNTAKPERSKGALARLVGWVSIAFAEGFLRDQLFVGTVFFSIIVIVIGATSGSPAWMVGYIVAGVIGIALVAVALKRRWSLGRQWLVIIGVIIADVLLMAAFWGIR
ncbi:hypothetical protein OG203_27625 [Nocardia sp. NBC_01499]|uniref:hypothetical protein n=1 Tax=Nocardia sp. NBC_01499 TaxID=2903597 RepID=UPI0038699F5A